MKANENPFSVERVLRVRYRPRGWTWDALMARLAERQFRAAIVGSHGSGKTTLLEDLQSRLHAIGLRTTRWRLDEDSRAFSIQELWGMTARLDRREVILFDGFEQLSLAARWFLRWCWEGGLIVTSHQPTTLPTLVRCEASEELLREIVTELGGEQNVCDDVASLFVRHHGNIRDALREMYDRCAGISDRRMTSTSSVKSRICESKCADPRNRKRMDAAYQARSLSSLSSAASSPYPSGPR